MGIAGVAAIARHRRRFRPRTRRSRFGQPDDRDHAVPPRRHSRCGPIGPRSTPIGARETVTFKADRRQRTVRRHRSERPGHRGPADVGRSDGDVVPARCSRRTWHRPRTSRSSTRRSGSRVVSNTTTVTLSPDGEFSVFNESGSTNVVIDVLGVFAPGSGDGWRSRPGRHAGLVGPAGPVGPAGAAGAQGVTGAPGANGRCMVEPGAAGAAGQLVRRGDSGAAGCCRVRRVLPVRSVRQVLPVRWSAARPVRAGCAMVLRVRKVLQVLPVLMVRQAPPGPAGAAGRAGAAGAAGAMHRSPHGAAGAMR